MKAQRPEKQGKKRAAIPKRSRARKRPVNIGEFREQRHNANKHTERGLKLLNESVERDGWIGALTVAADGETFDGSARLATAQQDSQLEPIVVESDGTRPVIVRRTDIATADDPKAKRLGVMANHVTATDWEPDAAILAEIAKDDAVIAALTKEDARLLAVVNQENIVTDPMAEWQGMPEFEHEDQTAEAAFTIRVFLKDANDLEAFGRLLGKDLTGRKFVWFSKQPRGDLYEAYDEPPV